VVNLSALDLVVVLGMLIAAIVLIVGLAFFLIPILNKRNLGWVGLLLISVVFVASVVLMGKYFINMACGIISSSPYTRRPF